MRAASLLLTLLLHAASAGATEYAKLNDIPKLQSINGYSTDDLSHCKYIYLDVGSNRAMHIKFLFMEKNFPKAVYPKMVFHKFFPSLLDKPRKDVCAFGFEPNPAQVSNLMNVEKNFNDAGHFVRIFNVGLSNYTGVLALLSAQRNKLIIYYLSSGDFTFYLQPKGDPGGLGFSGFDRHPTAQQDHSVRVDLVDVSDFVATLFKNVDLHSENAIHASKDAGDPAPALIAKFDPEGFEYTLIQDLVERQLLCKFTTISVEWHHDRREDKRLCSLGHPNVCEDYVQKLPEIVNGLIRADPSCHFTGGFKGIDDESYPFDH